MKHNRVDIGKLAQTMQRAAKGKLPAEIAAAAKVHPSRVTRFLNGEFKKVTPVLRRVCASLSVSVDKFLLDAPALDLPPDILSSLRRIVGRDPARAAAATRLLRSLEVLTGDRRLRGSRKGRG